MLYLSVTEITRGTAHPEAPWDRSDPVALPTGREAAVSTRRPRIALRSHARRPPLEA